MTTKIINNFGGVRIVEQKNKNGTLYFIEQLVESTLKITGKKVQFYALVKTYKYYKSACKFIERSYGLN